MIRRYRSHKRLFERDNRRRNRGVGLGGSYSANDHVLESGYTVGHTWAGLIRAWMGLMLSRHEEDLDKIIYYQKAIRKLQMEMREVDPAFWIAEFPELKLEALDFYDQNREEMELPKNMTGEEVLNLLREADAGFWNK